MCDFTYAEYGPFRVYMTLTGYVVRDERTQEDASSRSLSYETALRIAQGRAEDEAKRVIETVEPTGVPFVPYHDGTEPYSRYETDDPEPDNALIEGGGILYGQRVPHSSWTPQRSVIGTVETSSYGNVVLRVGRENGRGGEATGWHQTEHVTLRPDEARDFAREVLVASGADDLALDRI